MVQDTAIAPTTTDPANPAGKVFFSFADLQERWGCSLSKLERMGRADPLFPPVHRIGDRTKRVKFEDVLRYEAARVEKR